MASPLRIDWLQAMNAEMNPIDSHETFEFIDGLNHAQTVPLIWVHAVKADECRDVVRHKMRLQALGSIQGPGVDYFETYTCSGKDSYNRESLVPDHAIHE